jgi:redox-sensitive bicupin YhaK (pirin superfamily)
MPHTRKIDTVFESVPTLEGAGVHLRRAFGHSHAPMLDPFLLLDDFRSDDPAKYMPGFPWHPHRGIETVTYMLEGVVEHGDSMGNSGVIGAGDMQWMTAGSGIIHQEMPKPVAGRMERDFPFYSGDQPDRKGRAPRNLRMGGFQLWVNLPAKQKMMAPRYRGIESRQVPLVEVNGARVKVLCGRLGSEAGPVKDLVVDSAYFDVELEPGKTFVHDVMDGFTAFSYVIGGDGEFSPSHGRRLGEHSLAIYERNGAVEVKAGAKGLRFLLVSGKPIGEPVAWWGPIVMNTKEELEEAFREYEEGTFIKKE